MIEPNTLLQNRYHVVRKLGQGGMGAVYLATDQRFGSSVALKQTLVHGDTFHKAFEREAKLLNNLKHAALPHVIDYFREGEGEFLVMEFIPGEDLASMLRTHRQPFNVADVLQWADQLLDLLDYLHSHEPPIVHRDIKPENLKLTPRGAIVLLDFGLAKGSLEVMQATRASIVGYTPSYAPLEQIRGTGTDPRSDLYALAATLFHLVTNHLPPDALMRADAIVNGRPDPLRPANEFNPLVPAAGAAVLYSAMALRTGDRPVSASAMRIALKQAVLGDQSTIPLGGSTSPVGRSTSRSDFQPGQTRQEPPIGTAPRGYPTTTDPRHAIPPTVPAPPPVPPTTVDPRPKAEGGGMKVVAGLLASIVFILLGLVAVLVYFAFFDKPKPDAAEPPKTANTQQQPPTTNSGSTDPKQQSNANASVSNTSNQGDPPSGDTPSISGYTVSASSSRAPIGANSYTPEKAVDGRPETAWIEGAPAEGVGESFTIRFTAPTKVKALRVLPGYFKNDAIWAKNNRLAEVTFELSDGRRVRHTFTDAMTAQSVSIGGSSISWIRIVIGSAYLGGDDQDTCLSEVEIVRQ